MNSYSPRTPLDSQDCSVPQESHNAAAHHEFIAQWDTSKYQKP